MDVRAIADRAEIADLLALYCRGLDRMDGATQRSIYHDDAVEDRGEGLFVGRARDWGGWTLELLPVFAVTRHLIMNSLVELHGDGADGEACFMAYHRFGLPPVSGGDRHDVARRQHRTDARRPLSRPLRARRRRLEDRLPQNDLRTVPNTGRGRRVVRGKPGRLSGKPDNRRFAAWLGAVRAGGAVTAMTPEPFVNVPWQRSYDRVPLIEAPTRTTTRFLGDLCNMHHVGTSPTGGPLLTFRKLR
jgi:hypothetical protein